MTKSRISLWFLLFNLVALSADVLPNYPLVKASGKPFQLYDLKGQFVLVSFIFTRCPLQKMCPLTITLNQRVLAGLAKKKIAPKTHLLFVTLDPEHDTASTLNKFAKARGLDQPTITLATGNSNALADLASQFNVIGFPSADSSLISHNLKTILLDPSFRTIKEFKDNEWAPKDVIDTILKESRK